MKYDNFEFLVASNYCYLLDTNTHDELEYALTSGLANKLEALGVEIVAFGTEAEYRVNLIDYLHSLKFKPEE